MYSRAAPWWGPGREPGIMDNQRPIHSLMSIAQANMSSREVPKWQGSPSDDQLGPGESQWRESWLNSTLATYSQHDNSWSNTVLVPWAQL